MSRTRSRDPARRWIAHAKASALGAVIAIGITWFGASYDHPLDASIVEGMTAPECADVRAMPAGSMLSANLPTADICSSFFLYRASLFDAANDVAAYETSVRKKRVDEFWQLVGYLTLPVIVAFNLVPVGCSVVRALRRKRRPHPAPCVVESRGGDENVTRSQ